MEIAWRRNRARLSGKSRLKGIDFHHDFKALHFSWPVIVIVAMQSRSTPWAFGGNYFVKVPRNDKRDHRPNGAVVGDGLWGCEPDWRRLGVGPRVE